MNVPREILTALALGPLLGAIGSGLIGTDPRQIRTGEADPFAEAELAPFSPSYDLGGAYPDHYPLITPRGRVEVSELSMHGLYRSLRPEPLFEDGWLEPQYAVETALIADESRHDPELDAVLAEAEAADRRLTETAEAPGEHPRASSGTDQGARMREAPSRARELNSRLRDAAQADRPSGSPRIIHVATELAQPRQRDFDW